jgi:hypothetical protein
MRSPTLLSVAPLAAVAALVALLAGCSSADTGTGPATNADASATGDAGVTDVAAPKDGATGSTDAGEAGGGDAADDTSNAGDAAGDGGDGAASPECAPYGAPGQCITVTACAALGDHTSYAGLCPGAADIECCIVTPSTANNPPTPAGYVLMQQADVTSAMTTWAVAILNDPAMYPMFSTTTMLFGTLLVLARVEWHPPDVNNTSIHRGVTLYEPAG